MARSGRTWTRNTPSGIHPGRGSCGGAPDSVHRRRGVGAVPVLRQVLVTAPLLVGCSTLTSVDVLV